jgi:hypothetical protein
MNALFVTLNCVNAVATCVFVVLSFIYLMPKLVDDARNSGKDTYGALGKSILIILGGTTIFAIIAIILCCVDGLSNASYAGWIVGAGFALWFIICGVLNASFSCVARKCGVEDNGVLLSRFGDRSTFGMSMFISCMLCIVFCLAAYCIVLAF